MLISGDMNCQFWKMHRTTQLAQLLGQLLGVLVSRTAPSSTSEGDRRVLLVRVDCVAPPRLAPPECPPTCMQMSKS